MCSLYRMLFGLNRNELDVMFLDVLGTGFPWVPVKF